MGIYIISSVKIILFNNFSLSLPDKIKVTDIKWLSVWSRHLNYNFGNILFPEDLSFEDNTSWKDKGATFEEDESIKEIKRLKCYQSESPINMEIMPNETNCSPPHQSYGTPFCVGYAGYRSY